MSERDEMYGALLAAGFIPGQWNVQAYESQINLYPPGGGCVVLYPDGRWDGDIAPFAD